MTLHRPLDHFAPRRNLCLHLSSFVQTSHSNLILITAIYLYIYKYRHMRWQVYFTNSLSVSLTQHTNAQKMADETPSAADAKLEIVEGPTQVPLASAEKETPIAAEQPLPPAAKEEECSEPAVAEPESVSVTEKVALPPPPPQTSEAVDKLEAVTVTERETPLATPPASESDPPVKILHTQVEGIESEKGKHDEPKKIPETLVSFKEESNRVSDLSDSERKALEELKLLVQEALKDHQFTNVIPPPPATNQAEPTSEITSLPDEISIWGVPLLKDERTDVILLKFLRARDFKVKDAFVMLKNTIQWRRDFNIDALINENLGDDLEKVVFMHGFDKDGHPVCYNVYGEFQNKELYNRTFSDAEKRMRFLRWRIQFLEKSIRKLDFSPGGVCTIFQVSDLKNSPGPAKRELRIATRQALQLLQDNYPEFVAKQVFINVPWWYLAFYTIISPFLTQRTKSKFVFSGPSKTAETLFKYIPPEQVPIQYGGLSIDYCDCNPEFTINDPATEITVKPATKQTVEILVNEKCVLVWELRVVGWEVSYGAEFVPNDEGAYTVVIQKTRKMAPTDEPVVCNSFRITDLGKILLTVDNPSSKKKKLVYRFKVNLF